MTAMFFANGLAALGPVLIQAGAPAPVTEVALSPWVQRLHTVEVTIDGQKATMLFDSGGGATVISPAFARKIGCEPYGSLAGFTMTGERANPSKCGLRDVRIGGYGTRIEILAGDAPAPRNAPAIDGVLSLNAFEDRAVTIDFGDRRLIVESPASLAARTAGKSNGRIRLMREMGGLGLTAFAQVHGPRGDLWFLVDSNNQARTRMSLGAAEEFGFARDAVATAVKEKRTLPVDLEVDGVHGTPEDGPTQIAPLDIIYDGAFNERFVYWHDVTLDLGNRKAWYIFDPKVPSQDTSPQR